jgi:hypothetical protein
MEYKVLRKLLSLSEKMVYHNMKLNQRCSKDSLVVALVVVLFLHGAKTTILEKLIDDHKDTILTMFGGGEK